MNDFTKFGYLRVATVSPELRIGDPVFNAERIVSHMREVARDGVSVVLFPELCLTGYSCGDLFFQSTLRSAAIKALKTIAAASAEWPVVAVVGLPVEVAGRLFNCAAVLARGEICGIVPKTFLPTSGEYYEERWFARAGVTGAELVRIGETVVPFGADLLFEMVDRPGCRIGIEICEDLWAVEPPSGLLALSGATLILNPSASVELLGKATYRRDLVRQQSARCLAGYAYAGAGPWESSMDMVFSGAGLLAECGLLLAEAERFSFAGVVTTADFDMQRIAHERLVNSSFSAACACDVRVIAVATGEPASPGDLRRPIDPRPFVPAAAGERAAHCHEIFSIQSTGLARRFLHTGSKKLVLGLSGGLDSTLAALVCVRTLKQLGRPATDLLTVVMPGPGSTDRTQKNATALAAALGAENREIPIHAAVALHLSDIGQPEGLHDATYENTQARERTQILMNLANQCGGIVVGTGDLSEAALGWCTFNGDHMSMYHVNAGVPKTLVRHLVEWCAVDVFDEPVRSLLLDIAATPISPELLPLGADAALLQKTEETVGPYELHDFFLFQMLRHGFGPAKILALAGLAFDGVFDRDEIRRWLRIFYTMFFASQFKRSSMPDGPKVGTVALSPRGDWRMPSDATATTWLTELDQAE
jgi:NAD+ synthase (glutamine-hydrolysing)